MQIQNQAEDFLKVIKRDGRRVPYDIERVRKAIKSAFIASNVAYTDDILDKFCSSVTAIICTKLKSQRGVEITIEEVQKTVISVLIGSDYKVVADCYSAYRDKRTCAREKNTKLMNTYAEISFSSKSDLKRENGNINGDTAMGMMLRYGSEGAKMFNLTHVIPQEFSLAHQNCDIHIHDLDFYTLTMTCCQTDLEKLFKNGFSTGHGTLREPSNIMSASSLACIAIQSVQNDMHGGQSLPILDYNLAPYVTKSFLRILGRLISDRSDLYGYDNDRVSSIVTELKSYARGKERVVNDAGKSKIRALFNTIGLASEFECLWGKALTLLDSECYQAMEAMVHNFNTLNSRAGAQVPFSSVNFGTDTSYEGREIIKNLLLAIDAGLGNGETSIFPVAIFKIKEGVNYYPKDPNYDMFKLACKVSAKRLFPNFSFLDSSFNKPYYKEGHPETEVAYMGCRTRVMGNVYDRSKEIVTGRGNLSFTSINLPRLGLKADGDLDKFFVDLDDVISLVIRQLTHRFKYIAQKRVYNFPFLMGQGIWLDSDKLKVTDTVEEVMKHGTMSVGFIGLAECLVALVGKHHGESAEALDLGLRIVGRIRKRCDEESARTGLNYTCLGTPAEGLSGRFVKADKELFGIIPGVTDRDYYTNSSHVPVYFPISFYDKIRIEGKFHALENAGHIGYVELKGDPQYNVEGFMQVIKCMHDNDFGYGSVNHQVDYDPVCGYRGIIGDVCPRCGRHEGESVSEEKLDELRKLYPNVPLNPDSSR